MKCLCSLDNGYEIIGLCNLEKFNKKIQEFDSNSWKKLIITETLAIPEDKFPAHSILKSYIHIEITDYKILDTPISNQANIEGLKLTGKILSVGGIIKQNIIYKSVVPQKRTNSIKLDIPFNTYIVIDENTNINTDKFCVYTCIDNLSLNILDKITINSNISLFLFARKIEPPKEYLTNDIIFRNDNNQEIVKIRFDSTNKVFFAKSTNNIQSGPVGDVFLFTLYNTNGTTKKLESKISANQNANNFVSMFRNKPFEYGDIIRFNFLDKPNRVVITNYPNVGVKYNPVFLNDEAFKITPNGLVKYTLKNKIMLLNENNNEITSINFSLLNNFVDVTFSGNKAPVAFRDENYFTATLKDLSGLVKVTATIEGDQSADFFQSDFTEQFEFNDILEIFCEEPNKVKITNFPTPNQTYTFTQKTEFFTITRNGLLKLVNPIIKNLILFKSKNPIELVSAVQFDSINKTLFVDSYGVQCGFQREFQNQNFFELILKSNAGMIKKQGIIRANEDGTNFKSELNTTPFEYGDILTLKYKLNKQISIINFPSDGYDYERFWASEESFKLTRNGLTGEFNSLKSYIIIEAFDDTDAGRIRFNIDNLSIAVDSTRKIIRQGFSNEYFALVLKNSNGTVIKHQFSLTGNESFDNFKNFFSGKNFQYGDIITLRTASPTDVEIYNSPDVDDFYQLGENSADFRITQNGIIKL